jgi:hypothetical protein
MKVVLHCTSRMLSDSLDVLYVVVWRPLADSLSAHIFVSACLQTVKKQRTEMHDFIVCIGIYSGPSFKTIALHLDAWVPRMF